MSNVDKLVNADVVDAEDLTQEQQDYLNGLSDEDVSTLLRAAQLRNNMPGGSDTGCLPV
jgi:hypothetical protein